VSSSSRPEPVRLALFAALPSHFQAPLYRRLEADPRLDFTALFASTAGVEPADLGYGRPVTFEEGILDGYRSEFLRGARSEMDLWSFWALHDPDIARKLHALGTEVLWMHGYNYLVFLMATGLMRLRGLPVMFREEQTLIHPRSLPKTLVKELALRLLFRRSYGLYIGSESRRWFEHYGVPDSRLFGVPYCVDNQRLRAESERLADARVELRREFGLPEEQPVFVTVSRLIPKKQPLALLEGFRRAREQTPCSLLIVGSGELEGPIRDEVRKHRIPDVVLTGFLGQAELPRAYASADAFVLFSRLNETFGVVVNEAMNFGLPVLVSDKVGCGRDLVHEDRNGYTVHSEDVEQLSERMVQLAEDPALRARLGQESIEMIDGWNMDMAAAGVVAAVAAAVGEDRWERASPVD
jgi:glycosyltransferase involved in cell wall biosynthesis